MRQRYPRPTFVDFVTSLGVELTPAQRVLARIAFDGEEPRDLYGEDRDMCRALFGDADVIPSGARGVLVEVCGARSGKSYLSGLRLLHLALVVNLAGLAPGEVGAGLIVAPDLRLARQCLRYVSGACEHRSIARMVVAETADSVTIERPDGKRVAIEALPASRGGSAVRGRSLVGAVLDESAFFFDGDTGYVVSDVEVYRAVMPRVVKGGQTIVASTPWVRAGLLFELFTANARTHAHAIAAHAPTVLMRDFDPTVVAIVERETARDAANAEREFGASFVDSSASLLSSEDVNACVDAGVTSRPPRADVLAAHAYAMTIDVGLRNDSTVVMVGHIESRSRPGAPVVRILVVDACVILKPLPLKRITIDQVEDEVAKLSGRYNVTRVAGDIHMADAIGPRLEQRGIKFVELPMSPNAQETRGKTLAAMFSALAVRLVDEATLVSQLRELKVTRHAGGRVSIGAQSSKHDDAADALLLLCDVSSGLPACGGDADRVEMRFGRPHHDEEGFHSGGVHYVQIGENGRETPAEIPEWDPYFAIYAEEMLQQGVSTPAIERWRARGGPDAASMNVSVEHEGTAPRADKYGPGFGGWGFNSNRK